MPNSVVEVLRIDARFGSVSDPKNEAFTFFRNNHLADESCQHFFATADDQLNECAKCKLHPDAAEPCSVITPEHGWDLLVIGAECPPFSVQRPKRFQAGSVMGYKTAELSIGTVPDLLDAAEPSAFIMEQVEGFLKVISATDKSTGLQKLKAAMRERGQNYTIRVFRLDAKYFLAISRPRSRVG